MEVKASSTSLSWLPFCAAVCGLRRPDERIVSVLQEEMT